MPESRRTVLSAAHKRLDDFRQQGRVQAGSLIISVFGDAILPRGSRIWLGSLIRLLKPLELNERLVRTAVFRLAKEEWLRTEPYGRRTDYLLTPSGQRRFEEASRHIYASSAPLWDRRWRLIVTVGELTPKEREALRSALFWQGFGTLGGDCYVHPSADLSAAFDALLAEGLADRAQRDRVDYAAWKRAGYLETTPGRAISKRAVLQRVAQICADFDVQSIAADRWRLADFKQQAEDDGITLPELVEFGQGFKDMSPALDEFETAILNRTVAHNGHPVLTWCAANAVTDSDPAGNRKLNKAKAKARIDLVVAAVMAYASAAPSANTTEKSWWEVEA